MASSWTLVSTELVKALVSHEPATIKSDLVSLLGLGPYALEQNYFTWTPYACLTGPPLVKSTVGYSPPFPRRRSQASMETHYCPSRFMPQMTEARHILILIATPALYISVRALPIVATS
jgi:hypothetical protein